MQVWRAPHLQNAVTGFIYTSGDAGSPQQRLFQRPRSQPGSDGNSKVSAAKAARPGLFTLTCIRFTICVIKVLLHDVESMIPFSFSFFPHQNCHRSSRIKALRGRLHGRYSRSGLEQLDEATVSMGQRETSVWVRSPLEPLHTSKTELCLITSCMRSKLQVRGRR